MMKEEHFWYWLCNIPGLGRKTINSLLDDYGSPENIYYEDDNVIIQYVKATGNHFCNLIDYSNSKMEESIIYSYGRLDEKKVTFIHPQSDSYPERLKVIPDAPLGLYYKGKLPNEDECSIAIIGARNSTHYGKEMARFFGRELSKEGVTVISGLARGIDGMAHRGAIEAGCYTLGVLGCGIDIVYPEENYELFIEMEKSGGIISESNIGIKPYAGLFPQRNRIISGLADAILVIEATEKSGTFITVDQGLEQGKEIFALPGRLIDKTSRGCNNLIKMGAHFVTDVDDILEILCGRLAESGTDNARSKLMEDEQLKNLLAPTEKIVYSVLSVEPKYIDDIIMETRLSPGDVCMHINRLCVEGYIKEPARNYYSVKI